MVVRIGATNVNQLLQRRLPVPRCHRYSGFEEWHPRRPTTNRDKIWCGISAGQGLVTLRSANCFPVHAHFHFFDPATPAPRQTPNFNVTRFFNRCPPDGTVITDLASMSKVN